MIYIYTFAASIFFAYLAERSKNKGVIVLCSVISILIPSILGGLRAYGVGTDTMVYGRPGYEMAMASPNFAYYMSNYHTEPGFGFLTYFVAKIFGTENWCYFFYQLITISCLYIGAWKHRNVTNFLIWMLCFFLMHYTGTWNTMRQSLAASIIFMGLDTLERKEYGKFTLYVAIATLFHYSAVSVIFSMGLSHYVVTSEKFRNDVFFRTGIICCVLLACFMLRNIMLALLQYVSFLGKYEAYFSGKYAENSGSNSFSTIMFGEIILLILYTQGAKKNFTKTGNYSYNLNFYLCNIFFVYIYQIFIKAIATRVCNYSFIVNTILLSQLPSFIKEKNLKLMVGIILFVVMIFFRYLAWARWDFPTWPYRSIL